MKYMLKRQETYFATTTS